MTQIIPLTANKSQTLTTNLDGQVCQINVYQKFYGIFVDLYHNNVLVIGGVLAQNCNRIVRDVYLGFSGDLMFWDTQGNYVSPPVNFGIGTGGTNPYYEGLGTRFQLLYLSTAELTAAGLVG